MKRLKFSLPVKIMIGMVAGILFGVLLHSVLQEAVLKQFMLIKIMGLGGSIFLNMFRMIVVPVVLISMIRGVTSMNNPILLGRVGVKTLLIFGVTTVIASFAGIATSFLFNIGKGATMKLPESAPEQTAGTLKSITETFAGIVPQNIFRSIVDENMLQIIFIAIITGIAISLVKDRLGGLLKLLEELDTLNIKIVELILAIAPYGVFCLLAESFSNFGFSALLPLLKYLFCILLAMLVLVLIIYPLMLVFMARISPVRFYRKFSSVMLLAFSTSSSNATLPANIETLSEDIGVSSRISTFILSLGATVNMNGTVIMQSCAAIFIAQLYGVELTMLQLVEIIVTCLVASIGTAGMPGAGIIMLGLVLQTAGLPVAGIGLILGVDRLVDMFRTVVNITGDAVTATVVAASEKELDFAKMQR